MKIKRHIGDKVFKTLWLFDKLTCTDMLFYVADSPKELFERVCKEFVIYVYNICKQLNVNSPKAHTFMQWFNVHEENFVIEKQVCGNKSNIITVSFEGSYLPQT